MGQRYDLVTAREDKNGKTWWTRVGVAFENQNGDGFSLSFEALPLPSLDRDGKLQVRVLMRVPRERQDDRNGDERDGRGRRVALAADRAPPFQAEVDDEIPF